MIRSLVGIAVVIMSLAVAVPAATAQQQMINGRLLEDITRRPVESATIMLLAANGRQLDRVAPTNKFGTFSMRVEPGRYRLSVRRLGYEPVSSDILEVQPGRNVTVNYTLTPVTLRLAKMDVVARPGLETGEIGMAKRCSLQTGGVCLFREDFREVANKPLWEIVGKVPGLNARIDGSLESYEGNRCLQFLVNRQPVREVPGQFIDIAQLTGESFASLYEMLPDGMDIMGIEVYRSFKEVPEELRMDAYPGSVTDKGVTPPRRIGRLASTNISQACGLVSIWTSAAWR